MEKEAQRLEAHIDKLSDSLNKFAIEFARYGAKVEEQSERLKDVIETIKAQTQKLNEHDKYNYEILALGGKVNTLAADIKILSAKFDDIVETSLAIKLIRTYPKSFFITVLGILAIGATGIIEAVLKHTKLLGL